jgi:hypothetical protein
MAIANILILWSRTMRNGRSMQYELENEFENEYEGEYEGEFENEYEGEFENEYEGEYEGEFENEYEGEYEGEFENEYEGEYEGEFENEYESEAFLAGLFRKLAPMLRRIAPIAANAVGSAIAGQSESEGEYEYEAQPRSLAEAFAAMASQAESEAEAEAFAGAAIASTLPLNSASMQLVSPGLVKGAATLTRTLRKSPKTRPLVKMLPVILIRVRKVLAQQVARGRQITPDLAARIMAGETQKVLGSSMSANAFMDSSMDSSMGASRHAQSHRQPGAMRRPRSRHMSEMR